MKILELYSGIGGMHYAFNEAGILGEVIAAVDINTIANQVYKHNFPMTKLLERNIQSLSCKEIDKFDVDMILMSPPCQPFTRVGLKRDVSDDRSCSFLHILKILPDLNTKLKYILIENVVGFEMSEARNQLVMTLNKLDFVYQEFILSPSQFSIPNTRHRYYLIAKRKPLTFCFQTGILMKELPIALDNNSESSKLHSEQLLKLNLRHKNLVNIVQGNNTQNIPKTSCCYRIAEVLETGDGENYFQQYMLSDKILSKYAWLLDIVSSDCSKSCCFTKAYGRYVEGTGSVLCPLRLETVTEVYERSNTMEHSSGDKLNLFNNLKLRYFTPREIARLMCFPDVSFNFPGNITLKQRYRLLGNSINVHVVCLLISLMTIGDNVQCT